MVFTLPIISLSSYALGAVFVLLAFLIIYWVIKFVVSLVTGG